MAKQMYDLIRTPNMLPDRSADRSFDPDNPEEMSLTKQSFQQECDINHILKNNALVAPLTPEQYASLNFVDLGDSTDFHSAKNYLIEAEKAFMTIPADIRARFENDPGQFLDFVQNPKNADELVKLGLATEPVIPVTPQKEATPPSKGKTTPKAPEEAPE